MKLSERLERLAGLTVESPAPHLTGDMKFYVYDAETREALTEAAELARRVEGAAVGRVDMICAADAVVVDELAESALYALNKQRVRLVPEAGQGGG